MAFIRYSRHGSKVFHQSISSALFFISATDRLKELDDELKEEEITEVSKLIQLYYLTFISACHIYVRLYLLFIYRGTDFSGISGLPEKWNQSNCNNNGGNIYNIVLSSSPFFLFVSFSFSGVLVIYVKICESDVLSKPDTHHS